VTRPLVVAGGGVLWRGPADQPEVAVVHRPRYDDWSLPKGKAKAAEHLIVTAVREVEEETGSVAELGPCLLTTRYRVRVRGKVADKAVTYWSMRHAGGEFAESDEVDELEWLPVRAARRRLTKHSDATVLDAFVRSAKETRPLVLLRSGRTRSTAVRRDGQPARTLSRRGREQAADLVPVLDRLGVEARRSADSAACTSTLRPFGRAARTPITVDARLGRSAYPEHQREVLKELVEEATRTTTALCGPRSVVADLVGSLGRLGPARPPHDVDLRKGGWWLLHLQAGRVVAHERHEPVR
jgi:8-oxo-(d)GTP phosphatase